MSAPAGFEVFEPQKQTVCTCQFGAMSVLLVDMPDDADPHGPSCPLSRQAHDDPSDDPEFQAWVEKQWHEAAVRWAEDEGIDQNDPNLDEMFADREAAWAETYAEDAMWDRGC